MSDLKTRLEQELRDAVTGLWSPDELTPSHALAIIWPLIDADLTRLEQERDDAKTDHSLLCDDYKSLQADLVAITAELRQWREYASYLYVHGIRPPARFDAAPPETE